MREKTKLIRVVIAVLVCTLLFVIVQTMARKQEMQNNVERCLASLIGEGAKAAAQWRKKPPASVKLELGIANVPMEMQRLQLRLEHEGISTTSATLTSTTTIQEIQGSNGRCEVFIRTEHSKDASGTIVLRISSPLFPVSSAFRQPPH